MLAVEGDTFKTLGEHIRMQQMSNHAGNTNAYHRISHESNDVMTTWICLCFHRKFCRPLSRSFAQRQHTHKTQEETKEHEGTKSHHNATTVLYARNPTSLSLNSFLSQFSPANISKNLFDFVIVVCYCVPLGWCFNPLWSFMFFHWVENDQNDLVVHALHALHNLTLHAWRCTLCARSLYGTPGSCEDECRLQAHAIFDHGKTWKVTSTRYVDPTTWPIQQTILQKAVTPQLTPTDWLPLPAFLMQAWNTMADSPVFFKSVWSNKDNFFQSQVWPIPNQTLR